MLFVYELGRSLRSSGSSLLALPQSRTKTFCDSAFRQFQAVGTVSGAENNDILKVN